MANLANIYIRMYEPTQILFYFTMSQSLRCTPNYPNAGTCPGKAVGVKIRLDNGVSGFIPIKNLSDSAVINPEERVQRNQSIYCRIVKINPEKFSIDAICKSSSLEDKENEWKPRKDR